MKFPVLALASVLLLGHSFPVGAQFRASVNYSIDGDALDSAGGLESADSAKLVSTLDWIGEAALSSDYSSDPFIVPRVDDSGLFKGILYSLAGSPNGSIWFLNSDGTNVKITDGRAPRLSPDGRTLLFQRDGAFARGSLYTRDLQSGSERLIFQNNDWVVGYDFTPDSSQVVFDYACDVDIANLDGSNRRFFFGGDCVDDAPSISAANGRMVWQNNWAGGLETISAIPDLSDRHIVPNTTSSDVWPAFSPDGQWISFISNGNVYKIRADGSQRTQLTFLTSNADGFKPLARWTPDGTTILVPAFIGGVNGIFAIAPDGTGATTLLLNASDIPVEFLGAVTAQIPVSSVDLVVTMSSSANPVTVGNALTYKIHVTNQGASDASEVLIVDALPAGFSFTGGTVSQGSVGLVEGNVLFSVGSLAKGASADLAFTVIPAIAGLFTNTISIGSAERDLAPFNNSASITTIVRGEPILKGIVYSLLDGSIWLHPPTGADTKVTDGRAPRISPDGRFMVFQRGGVFARGNVYVRDLQTGFEQMVFNNGDYVVGYDFTPDASQIIFDFACEIDRINRDGSNRQLYMSGNCYDDAPSINLMNGRVVWHNVQGGGGLNLSDPDGSNRHLIPNTGPNDVWPAWSPDGQWISFINGKNVFKIRADGTGRVQLTSLTAANDAFAPLALWTPDSQTIIAAGAVNGSAGLFAIVPDGSGFRPISTTTTSPEFLGSVTTSFTARADAPTFIAVTPTNDNHWQLTLNVQAGFSYKIESSSDLLSWTPVATQTATTSTLTVIDTQTAATDHRFYRASAQ